MPWARLDDTFHRHTRVQDALDDPLGPAAIGLWALALSWSYDPAGGKSSPFVPFRQVRRLVGGQGSAADLAELLVSVGLWEPATDGYVIHDWDDYRAPMLTQEARSLGGKARAATASRDPAGRMLPGGQPVEAERETPSKTQQAQQPPGSPAGPGPSSSPGTTRPVLRESGGVGEGGSGGKGANQQAQQPPGHLGWDEAWHPFLEAWGRRFAKPPTKAQAAALWDAVDAWPKAVATFVLECPPKARPDQVVEAVLDRYHAIRDQAAQEAARAEVLADARKRAEAKPRGNGQPTRVSAILDDLPM